MHLRSVSVERPTRDAPTGFPFAAPAIATLETLELSTPVTFLVGENGSGKSTFLEALAWAAESVAAGSASLDTDASLAHVRPLGRALRLSWQRRTRRGFFLRAEDFFGYVKGVKSQLAGFAEQAARVRAENPDLADGELSRINAPFAGSEAALRGRYGDDMDARSHGEQFLDFFQSRLVPGGLYLLDEPEAPLSPQRQLALLAILKEASLERACQFVVATHSPILAALPGATIVSFDEAPPEPVAWDDLEHVRLVRDFLNRPDAFLRHL